MWKSTTGIAAFLCLVFTCQTTRASILETATIQMEATSTVNGVPVVDSRGLTQNNSINPFSVAVNATNNPNGNNSIVATGSLSANWSNAATGTVGINMGWNAETTGGNNAVSFQDSPTQEPFWVQTFTTDQSGFYTVNYNTTLTGSDTFGASSFLIYVNSEPLGFANLNTSGTFQAPITAGTPYQVKFVSLPNVGGERRPFCDLSPRRGRQNAG
jgi:hypothetical protein